MFGYGRVVNGAALKVLLLLIALIFFTENLYDLEQACIYRTQLTKSSVQILTTPIP